MISPIDEHPRRTLTIGRGLDVSYVDLGGGDPIVFLHGNPTSSYLWRNIVPYAADLGRCLAPDLIGMGDSSKAPMYDYRFSDHVRHLDAWFDLVGATQRVHLVVHDWGSALGFHRAHRFPDQIASITYMEALVRPRPWSGFGEAATGFKALRTAAGEEMALANNFFVEEVLPGMTQRSLTASELERYRAPFPTRESRIPTLIWGRQIPIDVEGQPEDIFAAVNAYGVFLKNSEIPKLFVRATPGAILKDGGVEVETCRAWRNQEEVEVAGIHFLQEDSPHEIGAALRNFLCRIGIRNGTKQDLSSAQINPTQQKDVK